MKILGIDPGINNFAFAFLEVEDGFYKLRNWETINTNKQKNISEKLACIFSRLKETVENFCPDIMGIEEIFVNRYPRGGSKLAQAQAIALLVAGLYNIPVKLYHPTEIKKFFTQYGKAKKEDLFHIFSLFFKEKVIEPNIELNCDSHKIDALAIALILAMELQH